MAYRIWSKIKPLEEGRPTSNLLIGWEEIEAYMRFTRKVLLKWRRLYQFPVLYLPQGRVATTTSLIDAWMANRIQASEEAMQERAATYRQAYEGRVKARAEREAARNARTSGDGRENSCSVSDEESGTLSRVARYHFAVQALSGGTESPCGEESR